MAAPKQGHGPTLREIIDDTGTARDLLNRNRVVSFLNATRHVSPNRYPTKQNGGRRRFVQRESKFACDLRSHLCCAKKKDGRPCTRNVVRGVFLCWQHLKSIYKLVKGKSTIPNTDMFGLFACEDIPKNTIIIPYFGEQLDKAQLDARYPGDLTAPYGYKLAQNKFIDSACFQGTGGLINRPLSGHRSNAQFKQTNKGFPQIVSTKRIRANDEIFIGYGPSYKFTDSGIVPRERIREHHC